VAVTPVSCTSVYHVLFVCFGCCATSCDVMLEVGAGGSWQSEKWDGGGGGKEGDNV
jgi:hypothetical protein